MIGLAAAEAVKSTSAWDQPGTLGFLVVFGMAVILYFVFRSLARQLRKVNEAARAEAAQQGTVKAGASPAGAEQLGRGESQRALAASDYERQQSEANAATLDADF